MKRAFNIFIGVFSTVAFVWATVFNLVIMLGAEITAGNIWLQTAIFSAFLSSFLATGILALATGINTYETIRGNHGS